MVWIGSWIYNTTVKVAKVHLWFFQYNWLTGVTEKGGGGGYVVLTLLGDTFSAKVEVGGKFYTVKLTPEVRCSLDAPGPSSNKTPMT